MADPALTTTYNFLDLYVRAAGKWKTPARFHHWSALTLLSAAIGDRIYLDIFRHAPLYLNMWTFLIGNSGTGKDHAAGVMLSHVKRDDPMLVIDKRITVPKLYDTLAERQKQLAKFDPDVRSVPFFLISSDIPEQLPLQEAEDFCSRVLPMYGGRPRETGDATRTSGETQVTTPVMTWLAGTTPRWFPRAVSADVFHGGFAGRAFFVFGHSDRQYAHLLQPQLPPDFDGLMGHLRRRLELFYGLAGAMTLTNKGLAWMNEWLRSEQDKTFDSDVEAAVHERKRMQVLKLGGLLALAEWRGEAALKIKSTHLAQAVTIVTSVSQAIIEIGNLVHKTVDGEIIDLVLEILRRHRRMRRSYLMTLCTKRGVRDSKHMDAIIETIKQMGRVEIDQRPNRKGPATTFYVYRERPNLKAIIGKRVRARQVQEMKELDPYALDEEFPDEQDEDRMPYETDETDGTDG